MVLIAEAKDAEALGPLPEPPVGGLLWLLGVLDRPSACDRNAVVPPRLTAPRPPAVGALFPGGPPVIKTMR
ncbi:hypothetical protein ABZ726_17325 [Streptomyces hundungensis]|uniref:hypothetical protein n=1 Tax=Streptomyces hundungensis TaxID=1077946 RepID=UPI0033E6ED19